MIREQIKYRVAKDEGWTEAALGERDDYLAIPCRGKGKIYKHGADLLGYLSPPGRKTRPLPRLLALGCQPHQQGEHEFSVLFPVVMLDPVAAVVGAFKRRHLSGANRDAAVERLRLARAHKITARSGHGDRQRTHGAET